MQLPHLGLVEAAIAQLRERLQIVPTEELPLAAVAGRILAQPLVADRDSPSLDVSAMDGYALRLADIVDGPMPVPATTVAGAAPAHLPPLTAVKIFTGAAVPAGADCVIRREDTREHQGSVVVRVPRESIRIGQNIRRQGENIRAGQAVLDAGVELNSVAMAAVASFGAARLSVRRRVRVSILNTGDELAAPGAPVQAWQIRDSNGPTLEAWLGGLPWVEIVSRGRVADDFDSVRRAIVERSAQCEAVLLTGGVSMGDTDYVPGAIESLGGEIVFHRLPIRPGKPILGGCLGGALLLGLPGNPVSVAVTARVFGLPLLSHLAGRREPASQPSVELVDAGEAQLPLVWYRLVELDPAGRVRLVPSKGSGDVVSLAQSAGFITIPAGGSGRGPWPFTAW